MSKQSRKSISISAKTFDRLQAYCERHDKKKSRVAEEQIVAFLDREESGPDKFDYACHQCGQAQCGCK